VQRLFYDTVRAGFRRASQRASAAEVSVNIIDQCVAQGVPFAREYGGCWRTGVSAERRYRGRFTRAARRDSSCCWRVPGAGTADRRRAREDVLAARMLDLIVVDGRARGIVVGTC